MKTSKLKLFSKPSVRRYAAGLSLDDYSEPLSTLQLDQDVEKFQLLPKLKLRRAMPLPQQGQLTLKLRNVKHPSLHQIQMKQLRLLWKSKYSLSSGDMVPEDQQDDPDTIVCIDVEAAYVKARIREQEAEEEEGIDAQAERNRVNEERGAKDLLALDDATPMQDSWAGDLQDVASYVTVVLKPRDPSISDFQKLFETKTQVSRLARYFVASSSPRTSAKA